MEEVPLLKALHAKYSDRAVFLGISVDISVDRADRAVTSKGMTWLQLADGKGFDGAIPQAYHVQGTPELFVLDREGRIFAKPASAKAIETRLQEALARPPQQAVRGSRSRVPANVPTSASPLAAVIVNVPANVGAPSPLVSTRSTRR